MAWLHDINFPGFSAGLASRSQESDQELDNIMASGSSETTIKVTVLAANALVKRELFSLPNPFAVVTVDGSQTQQTAVIKKTLTPYWNETFDIQVKPSSEIEVQIFDHRRFKRQDQGFLGGIKVVVDELLDLQAGGHVIQNLDLKPGPDNQYVHGKLMFSLSLDSQEEPVTAGRRPSAPNLDLARSFTDLRVAAQSPTAQQGPSTLPRNRSLQPAPVWQ
ncbi:hypothetical protein EVG20_g7326, partial [Dentipellis fragilis]